MEDRIKKLQEKMSGRQIDYALINNAASIEYLTGFSFAQDTSSFFIVGKENSVLIISVLDDVKSNKISVEKYSNQNELANSLINLIPEKSKLGIDIFSHEIYKFIKKIFKNSELEEITDFITNLQAIKSPEEIEIIKKATKITRNAINFGFSNYKEGMTEQDVAAEIKKYIVSKGADYSFYTVQADENSAIPHYLTKDKIIEKMFVVDVGANYKGYSSDISRTFLLKPDEEMKRVYELIKKSQEESIKKIKPGVQAKDIDLIARNIIEKNGYRMLHSLGHGIGIIDDCPPKVSPRSNDVLKENMTLTIEPGIYLPGRFGIRIEDVILVKKEGYEIL